MPTRGRHGLHVRPRVPSSMRFAGPPRREIGIRTVFNILGPLTNPAGARRQVLGVADGGLGEKMAQVLRLLGSQHALVVHGEDGMDEVSLSAPTQVWELKDGDIRAYTIAPEDAGLSRASPDAIRGGSAHENAAAMERVLSGEQGAHRDVVLLNAAAALVAGDAAPDLASGAALAADAIDSGRALAKLRAFVDLSRGLE